MADVILRTAARVLIPMMFVFSIFLLLRGHSYPGGGFSAGLVVAAALALYSIAFDVASARKALVIEPRAFAGIGLMIAVASGTIGMFAGDPFLTGQWFQASLPGLTVDLGTPLLFDVGVYLAVFGAVLAIVFALEEE